MSVCLVATHWTPTLENCIRSLRVNNYSYTLLGWGEEWEGWSWRARKFREYLLQRPPKELIVLLDAYDTLAVRPASEVFETFKAFQRKIVVGCEWWCSAGNCGRVSNWWKQNKKKPSLRSKVNAGCVIGEADELLKAYSWILERKYEDDQRGLADWIDQKGIESVALDSGSALIYNANLLDGFMTPKTAFFLHFPGPLLKHGIMPMYNNAAKRHLSQYARLQYPSEKVHAILTFVFCAVLLIVYRLVFKKL